MGWSKCRVELKLMLNRSWCRVGDLLSWSWFRVGASVELEQSGAGVELEQV